MKSDIYLPQEVNNIFSKLNKNGFDSHIVGGCVRDALLGLVPHDYDICTSASPDEVLKCFKNNKTLTTGMKHGTITVFENGVPYEITSYRTEGLYSDSRHPDNVLFVRSIEEDLARRDFTINAMAYNPKEGLFDPFGGENDLKNKIIRCVGQPTQRFSEDALRIMRGLRFASVLGFEIDNLTDCAMRKCKNLLKKISSERIRTELLKLLCGKGCGNVLLRYSDILAVFIPEISPCIGFDQHNPHHCFDVWEHIVRSVQAAPQQPLVRFIMLLHDIEKPACFRMDDNGIGHFKGHGELGAATARDIMERMHFDKKSICTAETMIRLHDERPKDKIAVRRLIINAGIENFTLLLGIKRADAMAKHPNIQNSQLVFIKKIEDCFYEIMRDKECLYLNDLAVNGKDLIKLGFAGKKIGLVLNWLLDCVINEKLPNEKTALTQAASLHFNPDRKTS